MELYFRNKILVPNWAVSVLEQNNTYWGIRIEQSVSLPKGRIGLLVTIGTNIGRSPKEVLPWFAHGMALILCDKSKVSITEFREFGGLSEDFYMHVSRSRKSIVIRRYFEYYDNQQKDVVSVDEEHIISIKLHFS